MLTITEHSYPELRKADVPAEGQSAPKVVVIADHDGAD
jgi:hypothetical protein